MEQNRRKIALTWLWLAGLVIFLHAVIPHHHHYSLNESCSAVEKTSDNIVTAISHSCHAFNVLINDSKNGQQKIQETSGYFQVIMFSDVLNNILFRSKEKISLSYKDDLKKFLLFANSQPVRGSPFHT